MRNSQTRRRIFELVNADFINLTNLLPTSPLYSTDHACNQTFAKRTMDQRFKSSGWLYTPPLPHLSLFPRPLWSWILALKAEKLQAPITEGVYQVVSTPPPGKLLGLQLIAADKLTLCAPPSAAGHDNLDRVNQERKE